MKIVKIKGLWKGMIPLRDKYVDPAIANGEEIGVIVDDKKYKLTTEQLKNPFTHIIVPDKFSTKPQKLYYYKQVPKKVENEETLKLL